MFSVDVSNRYNTTAGVTVADDGPPSDVDSAEWHCHNGWTTTERLSSNRRARPANTATLRQPRAVQTVRGWLQHATYPQASCEAGRNLVARDTVWQVCWKTGLQLQVEYHYQEPAVSPDIAAYCIKDPS